MSVILDTHAFLWWLLADSRLSDRARARIEDGESTRFVSAVSAFEVTTKVRIGKLAEAREVADGFETFCAMGRFTLLPLRVDHALLAGRLPGEHRDPFDRMIAAQARIEQVPVLTADPAFRALDIETLW